MGAMTTNSLYIHRSECRQRLTAGLRHHLGDDGRVWGAEQRDGGAWEPVYAEVSGAADEEAALLRVQPFTMHWPERMSIMPGSTTTTRLVVSAPPDRL